MADKEDKIQNNPDNLVRLNNLQPGDRCIVKKVSGNSHIMKRIIDIGIHPGIEILVERVAPLGDPVEFKLSGFHVSLRREEAENILVERYPG